MKGGKRRGARRGGEERGGEGREGEGTGGGEGRGGAINGSQYVYPPPKFLATRLCTIRLLDECYIIPYYTIRLIDDSTNGLRIPSLYHSTI